MPVSSYHHGDGRMPFSPWGIDMDNTEQVDTRWWGDTTVVLHGVEYSYRGKVWDDDTCGYIAVLAHFGWQKCVPYQLVRSQVERMRK